MMEDIVDHFFAIKHFIDASNISRIWKLTWYWTS